MTTNYSTILDQLITKKRLSSYQKAFSLQNNQELFGAHLWNIHISAIV